MSDVHAGVDNTRPVFAPLRNAETCMIRSREDFYQPGMPAEPGSHYGALLRFAKRHAGSSVLDLGCGFGAYSGALMKDGLSCVGCDINLDYLRKAAAYGLSVANV